MGAIRRAAAPSRGRSAGHKEHEGPQCSPCASENSSPLRASGSPDIRDPCCPPAEGAGHPGGGGGGADVPRGAAGADGGGGLHPASYGEGAAGLPRGRPQHAQGPDPVHPDVQGAQPAVLGGHSCAAASPRRIST
eukprot:jgi/Botrbrau1/12563/Bobra.0169s0098.1